MGVVACAAGPSKDQLFINFCFNFFCKYLQVIFTSNTHKFIYVPAFKVSEVYTNDVGSSPDDLRDAVGEWLVETQVFQVRFLRWDKCLHDLQMFVTGLGVIK